MSKKEEREFFGHKFGQVLGGTVTREWTIYVPFQNDMKSVKVTLIGDKNHNLCKIWCDDIAPETQEEVYKILSHNRGQNIYTFGGEYHEYK